VPAALAASLDVCSPEQASFTSSQTVTHFLQKSPTQDLLGHGWERVNSDMESHRRLSRLSGEAEGGPEVRIGKIFRMQQGQLGFTPRLGARFAGAPAANEFGSQPAGRFVVRFPVTGQHGLGPAILKARRSITPSPIFASPEPGSQVLRMTSSVPCVTTTRDDQQSINGGTWIKCSSGKKNRQPSDRDASQSDQQDVAPEKALALASLNQPVKLSESQLLTWLDRNGSESPKTSPRRKESCAAPLDSGKP